MAYSRSARGMVSSLPLGDKANKGRLEVETIFRNFSLGVTAHRDTFTYNSHEKTLALVVRDSIGIYQATLGRYKSLKPPRPKPDEFIDIEDCRIKWTRQVKASLGKLEETHYNPAFIRPGLYRPFFEQYHYFDDFWNEERYQSPEILPLSQSENTMICAAAAGLSFSLELPGSKFASYLYSLFHN